MTEDRFACRREGHILTLKLTVKSANPPLHSYLTKCARCGEWIEVVLDNAAQEREAVQATRRAESS